MKFFKIFIALTLLVALLIPACANAKKRDLSTPLSRLVGHWQDRYGFQYYFGPVDNSTMTGLSIYKIPEEEKLMKFFKAMLEIGASEMLKQGKFKNRQEAKEWVKTYLSSYEEGKIAKNLAGNITYHQYKLLFQVPDGKKIEIFILWNENNLLGAPEETTFRIEKNGKQMLVNEEWGKLINPLKYIDSKTSPENK